MAWMRLMGADSVEYHKATVVGRADDHPGQALAYYASRGETPLRWGGSGAARLGLVGTVTDAQYEAVYGPGGACDPTTGQRMVRTLRPGMELVISAHKSVAELGVIGRAEHMHQILDAERDATLAYLDEMTRAMGGRRGRARTVTPTGGLVYAHTRHATSRAGDPCPHDHVLLANVVEMGDEAGGWKAPDMATWRDHLHAATMVGRVAGARKAVELGYGIEADPGRSGRLRHWRIAGIPEAVCELHSKRAADIDAAVAARGVDTYHARQMAARATRDAKRHTPVAELMGPLASRAGAGRLLPDPAQPVSGRRSPLSSAPPRRTGAPGTGGKILAAGGPLEAKVFRRAEVIVAVAPALFGHPPEELEPVVEAVLSSPEAIPLLRVAGARERHWAAAHTLATEAAIEAAVERGMATTEAAAVPEAVVAEALAATALRLGHRLGQSQEQAVWGICRGGTRLSLVLGVAGSGKTTTLSCVRAAYEAAGYEVLGTATAGQAARTLHRAAGMERSRTLASLLWRLDHHRLALTDRHVVVLDEAGMTEDPDLLRLLMACEVAGAKVVVVGDDRQLGPVGPGGALRALRQRHPHAVHVLWDNRRQADAEERAALAQLRAGDVGEAVSYYAEHGRLATTPSREEAIEAMVAAWAEDALAGRDAAMYAWRRANVADLNARAHQVWREAGRLWGPELEAPGGRPYAQGERVVTLAPGTGGKLVTSERGEVVKVDPDAGYLIARMHDGRFARLEGEELGPDRLDHAYATTVHRAQGATVDVAHRLEDGGGRELAYVAMSRAREASTVWVVADSLEQATEDLVRDWSAERRPRWAIDTGTPAMEPAAEHPSPAPDPLGSALTRARLRAERQALAAAIPVDPQPALRRVEAELRRVRRLEEDLENGVGAWKDTPVGDAARSVGETRQAFQRAEAMAADPSTRLRTRRQWRREVERLRPLIQDAEACFERLASAPRRSLANDRARLEISQGSLVEDVGRRERWLEHHPEAERRLHDIQVELANVPDGAHVGPAPSWGIPPVNSSPRVPVTDPDIGRSLDIGL